MIQIQHLLKLNIVIDCSKITGRNSNTTLVKVKLKGGDLTFFSSPHSNTTLVKVKCEITEIDCFNNDEFKYNTC